MNKFLFPIEISEFEQKINIRFNNIQEGFNKFKYSIIEDKSEEEWVDYMLEAYDENGFDNFYIDLYLDRIDESNEKDFLSLLNEEDKLLYHKIRQEYDKEYTYYKISKEIVPFITRLGTREALFCTFYLAKTNKTVWCNYGLKFPVFYG